jgi:hypothetical protein
MKLDCQRFEVWRGIIEESKGEKKANVDEMVWRGGKWRESRELAIILVSEFLRTFNNISHLTVTFLVHFISIMW